jgi:hypothetical protein
MIPWTLVMRIGPNRGFPLDFGDEVQLTKINYLKTLARKTRRSQDFLIMMMGEGWWLICMSSSSEWAEKRRERWYRRASGRSSTSPLRF